MGVSRQLQVPLRDKYVRAQGPNVRIIAGTIKRPVFNLSSRHSVGQRSSRSRRASKKLRCRWQIDVVRHQAPGRDYYLRHPEGAPRPATHLDLGKEKLEGRRGVSSRTASEIPPVGLTTDGSFELPITQTELSDTMGLSIVQNRSLKELREAGLVTMRDNRIVIPNVHRLKEYSDFDPAYLHFRWPSPEDD